MKRPLIISSIALFPIVFLFGFTYWPAEPYIERGLDTPGTLTVTAEAGADQVFTFERWQILNFEIMNDDWETVQAEVQIDHNSLQNDWEELEYSIRTKKDYFHSDKFPTSTVFINGATRNEDGSYTANATLNIKGVSGELPLQFEVVDGIITGGTTFNRRKFKFKGKGPANEVEVNFSFADPR